MKKKYQNGFFIFGIVVLIVMVTQLDFDKVWEVLAKCWVLVLCSSSLMVLPLHLQHSVMVFHHKKSGNERGKDEESCPVLVALQGERIGICAELCNPWWPDGGRALSYHGADA